MVSGPLPVGQSTQLLTRTHAPATNNIQDSLRGKGEGEGEGGGWGGQSAEEES